MNYILGLALWAVLGVLAGFAIRALYRADRTVGILSLVFGFFGALIGGMLGTAAYIFHDPSPLRPGGILGAVLGGVGFSFLYHFIARKAV